MTKQNDPRIIMYTYNHYHFHHPMHMQAFQWHQQVPVHDPARVTYKRQNCNVRPRAEGERVGI